MMRYFRNAYYICPYRLVVFVELSYMFATKLSLELNYDCTHTHTHIRVASHIYALGIFTPSEKTCPSKRYT